MRWFDFDRLCSQGKKKLRENGFSYYKPEKRDHEKWKNQDGKMVIVDHKILSRHTANEILKQAGIEKAF